MDTVDNKVYEEILKSANNSNLFQTDRIVRKTIVELVKSGNATFLFIRDDECREYWGRLVRKATETINKRKEAHRIYEIKLNAYNRLTEEDRKVLKIRKPAKPRS